MSLFPTFPKVITEDEINCIMDLSKIFFLVHKRKNVDQFIHYTTQVDLDDGTDFTLHDFKIPGSVNDKIYGCITA